MLDFCGINYYGRELVDGFSPTLRKDVEYSDSGRSVHPVGLYDLLNAFHARYKDDPDALFEARTPPQGAGGYGYIITENGIADSTDILRGSYIVEHLAAIAAARKAGIRVRGYIHWTLSDNWEWADGYCPKFGLVAVNRSTVNLTRTPRQSYYLWQRICREQRVSNATRYELWERVRAASAAGISHDMCRADDGVHSYEEPIPTPILGGTRHDWRFRLEDAETLSDQLSQVIDQASSYSLLQSIRFSDEHDFDPFASTVNWIAGLSMQPPSPPASPQSPVVIHFDKLNARLNKTAHIAAEAMMQSWQAFSQGFSSSAEQTEPAPALEDARGHAPAAGTTLVVALLLLAAATAVSAARRIRRAAPRAPALA